MIVHVFRLKTENRRARIIIHDTITGRRSKTILALLDLAVFPPESSQQAYHRISTEYNRKDKFLIIF